MNPKLSTIATTTGYYLVNYWADSAHPYGSNLPIIRGGPWKTIAFFIIGYILTHLAIRWNSNKSVVTTVRPALVIYNGFAFGVYSCAFMICFVLTSRGTMTMKCSSELHPWASSVIVLSMVRLSYIYYLMSYWDLGRHMLLSIKTGRVTLRLPEFLSLTGHAVLIQTLLNFWPGGVFAFVPTIYSLVKAIVYAHHVVSSTGLHSETSFWTNDRLWLLEFTKFFLIATHGFYFSLQTCDEPLSLRLSQALFGLFSMALLTAKSSRSVVQM